MSRPKTWLKVHIGGQRWTVRLVGRRSKKLTAELRDGCDGVTCPDECEIYIANDTSETAREDTLLHELLHASLWVSGAYKEFKEGGEAHDSEEVAVSALTPVLHRLFKDLGFQFPKAPGQ